MAVERVERLMAETARALGGAGIDYAVVGGNAVAAWVATVDEAAVRATKDVDILLRRSDLARAAAALDSIGLAPIEVLGVSMFVDRKNPNPKTGVHIVFAGEKVRSGYRHAAPDPARSREFPPGYRIVDLRELLAMKLQSFRFIDRAHVQDLLAVNLVDDTVRTGLPPDLAGRLREIEAEQG